MASNGRVTRSFGDAAMRIAQNDKTADPTAVRARAGWVGGARRAYWIALANDLL